MKFITPMFAAKMKEGFDPSSGEWVSEEKFDGIRIIATVDREVPEDLLTDCTVRTYSRNGIVHLVPPHLRASLRRLPTGIYDMEMFVPRLRSYGATRLSNADQLEVRVFDLLHLHDEDTMDLPLRDRRALLEEMFSRPEVRTETMQLAEQRPVASLDQIREHRNEVWARDGEGLIIKNLDSIYRPKSRRQNVWIKVKALRSALMTVVGFEPSKGEVFDRGPYATVVLEDREGCRTTVKTRNDEEIAKFEREASVLGPAHHPAIGRMLWIEYQERTPDKGYRHPMWDRWATKAEETDHETGELAL